MSKLTIFETEWGEIIHKVPSLLVIMCCQKLSHCDLHNGNRMPSLIPWYLITLQNSATSKLQTLAIKHQNDNFNSNIRILMP